MKITKHKSSFNIISYFFFLTVIITFLGSCTKTVDNIKIPEVPPKLVVYSYISPADTLVRVYVSMSVPVFNSSNNYQDGMVSNAIVVMWNDDGNTITIPYDNYSQSYIVSTSSFPIVAGKTYHIKVTAGDKTAESNCTVPLLPNNTLQFISMDSTTDQDGMKVISIEMNFNDTPGQPDYYRVYPMVFIGGMDSVYSQAYIEYGDELVSDKDKDGQTYSYIISYNYSTNRPAYFKIFLFHTDKDYYELHKSIFNYSGDSPFSEPSLIYSNMQGGYGVFAAYNPYYVMINI